MAQNENAKLTVKGDVLTITVNLKKDLGESASGKTTIIGKCRDNPDGHPDVTAQVTVYRKKK